MDSKSFLLGAVAAIALVVCVAYAGQLSITLGESNLSHVIEQNRQLQAQLDGANETIKLKEKAIDDFVSSPVYPLYMSWVEGNQQVGEVIAQAKWLVDNGQAAISAVQWLMSGGQTAIDAANTAKQASDAVGGIRQTLRV